MTHLLHLLLTSLTILLTTPVVLAQPALAPAAVVNIEAIWDDTSIPSNKTFAVPLNTVWQHEAFNQCDTLYLYGTKGGVDPNAVSCQLYWMKPSGQGYAGLWLTYHTPSSPHAIAADLRDASLQMRCQATGYTAV